MNTLAVNRPRAAAGNDPVDSYDRFTDISHNSTDKFRDNLIFPDV